MTQPIPILPADPPSERPTAEETPRHAKYPPTWHVEENRLGKPRVVYTDPETGERFYDYPPSHFAAQEGQLVPTPLYTPKHFELEAEMEAADQAGVNGGF